MGLSPGRLVLAKGSDFQKRGCFFFFLKFDIPLDILLAKQGPLRRGLQKSDCMGGVAIMKDVVP